MGHRFLMAGEWIDPHTGQLHGHSVCECHGVWGPPPIRPYYPSPEESPWLAEVLKRIEDVNSQFCERCRKKVLDPLCPACLEIALREEEAK